MEVRHLSPPHMASLRCTITEMDRSFSELTERLEDSQQAHTDTLQEVALTESLHQAANLVSFEKSVNHETARLRDDISRLSLTSDNIHRTQGDVSARLLPHSQALHQLQKTAESLEDHQLSFMKDMEYCMHRIGIYFQSSPILQDLLQPVQGHPPPTPEQPIEWPTHTVAACRAKHMSAFIHKEAACKIADHRHAFDLAKHGHAEEISRLREENRSLTYQLSQVPTDHTSTTESPSYSGQLRSLTAQRDAVQKRLKAAMATNTHITSQLQQCQSQPSAATTQPASHLHDQVVSLNQTIAALKNQHQTAMDSMVSDKNQSLMELRLEIETLHAEHSHDTAVTQNELQAKTGEIRPLKQDLAVCKAKGSKDLQEAKLAHKADRTRLSEAILPSVVQDLRTDISTQFATISQLTHKLSAAKAEAGDLGV